GVLLKMGGHTYGGTVRGRLRALRAVLKGETRSWPAMDIRADEISRIIREQLGGFSAGVDVAEVGTVLSVGDGIARLHGLERCMAGELLELPRGVTGIALNLEEDSVGAVLLGESR